MRQFLKHYLPKDLRHNLLKAERLINLLIKPTVLASLFGFRELQSKTSDKRFSTDIIDAFPVTGENTKYTSFDRHYVYHTSWAARVVKEIADMHASTYADARRDTNGDDAMSVENADIHHGTPSQTTTANGYGSSATVTFPFKHIDISSSLYFSGIASAFVPIEFYDYRPADLQLGGLQTHHGDLMKLPFADQSVESISCLHTIEHIGLGRYGDPLDPQGDLKALAELYRVVKLGGHLLIVVPVGKQKIQFNAHRIYAPENLVSYVTKSQDGNATGLTLKEYAYIPETDADGPIIRNADLSKGKDADYACGCFWFMRA